MPEAALRQCSGAARRNERAGLACAQSCTQLVQPRRAARQTFLALLPDATLLARCCAAPCPPRREPRTSTPPLSALRLRVCLRTSTCCCEIRCHARRASCNRRCFNQRRPCDCFYPESCTWRHPLRAAQDRIGPLMLFATQPIVHTRAQGGAFACSSLPATNSAPHFHIAACCLRYAPHRKRRPTCHIFETTALKLPRSCIIFLWAMMAWCTRSTPGCQR